MNYIIDRPLAKQAARNCMRTARVSPYQIALVLVLIFIAFSAFNQLMTNLFGIPYYVEYPPGYGYYLTVKMPSGINWFVTIFIGLVQPILMGGFYTYCLAVRRGKEMPVTTLFDGFSIAGKIILLQIVMSIFFFLWSLLLFIPGIIAMYRYRFAMYNLVENPDLGILEAINMSKAQTAGYKWQLFVLDLSFLGWWILSLFTMGLLNIWLYPYYYLTDIAFYDTICANKGISPTGQSFQQNGPSGGNPPQGPAHYDYDWNHQNSSWNAAPPQQTPPAQAPRPEQPPQQQDSSAQSGSAPQQPEEPWERKSDQDPWDRSK